MIPDLTDPLIRRQWDLEEHMLDAGMSAYRRRVEKACARGEGSTAGAANKLLKMTVGRLAAAIEEMVAHAASGAPGKRAIVVRKVEGLDPELVAFLTMSEVLNSGLGRRAPVLQQIAKRIAVRIEDEARLQAFGRKHRQIVDYVLDRLNKQTSNRDHKRTVLIHLLNQRGDEWQRWTDVERLHVGTRLIDLCVTATNFVCKVRPSKVHPKKNDLTKLQLTEEGTQWLAETDRHDEALLPRYLPMVIPPRPWTGPNTGGYITGLLRPRFVQPARGGGRQKVSPEDAPLVYATVNAVQATPWRINRTLYEHMAYAWDRKLPVALPPDNVPIPPKPLDIAENDAARISYRRAAKQAHLENSKLAGKRIAVGQAIAIAERYLNDESIYFVHHLDFRGRLYAIGTFLTPQGSDVSKALLHFAEGKPLGERGGFWLAVHGANTFGNDKVSLEDRVTWVEEHTPLIVRTAADPFADLWWTDAVKPWCFLAWCCEWAQAVKEGDLFVSRLPVALDGSCNGLQHYSAMLRDPVGGAAVNLVPAEKPSDIYGKVAGVVVKRLSEIAVMEDYGARCLSNRWLNFGIDRKMTKRPVMVLPYGGTHNACLRYVEEAYLKRVAEGTLDPFAKEARKAAIQFLASVVWQSISDVVVAARAAMDWLRSAAKIATAAGVPISWVAPSGFPVVQDYRDLTKRRVKTRLSGAVTFLTLKEETDRLCPRRQANGLPPNFVHSLDAAALCLTVQQARLNGIEHFAMIHDSYGTHPADTEKLSICLRNAFVDMYQGSDPLAELEKRLREMLPPEFADRLPPLPERGTLDLESILRSDFFFA